MTTTDTRRAPDTSAYEPQHEHTEHEHAEHEHSWTTESRHPTSAGHVLYVRCTACGTRRVDLQGRRDTPPAPLSRPLGIAAEPTASS